jgi:hypothetical protein
MGVLNTIINALRFNQLNWKAVLLCVFAATVFWFFNALNKSYSANINFPLTIQFDEERYAPAAALPEHIRLNVSGTGWNVLRKSSGLKVPPLILVLEHPAEVKKIVGSGMAPLVAPQLEGLQVNFVLTDTLQVDIQPKVKRRFLVHIDSVHRYVRMGFGPAGPVQIQPDSVWLEGPEALITSLPKAIQVTIPQDNIVGSFDEELEVGIPSEYINRDPPVVRVRFETEAVQQFTDTLEVRLLNRNRVGYPVLEPGRVVCTYAVPQSKLDSFSPDSVRALVDLLALPAGKTRMNPFIVGLPSLAFVLQVDSVTVTY